MWQVLGFIFSSGKRVVHFLILSRSSILSMKLTYKVRCWFTFFNGGRQVKQKLWAQQTKHSTKTIVDCVNCQCVVDVPWMCVVHNVSGCYGYMSVCLPLHTFIHPSDHLPVHPSYINCKGLWPQRTNFNCMVKLGFKPTTLPIKKI